MAECIGHIVTLEEDIQYPDEELKIRKYKEKDISEINFGPGDANTISFRNIDSNETLLESMRIHTNGRVGIGTTEPGTWEPSAKLTVKGERNYELPTVRQGFGTYSNCLFNESEDPFPRQMGVGDQITIDGTKRIIQAIYADDFLELNNIIGYDIDEEFHENLEGQPNHFRVEDHNGDPKLLMSYEGNVGIGTEGIPSEKLEVNGTVKAKTFDGKLDGSKITGNLTSATIPAGNITGELTSNQISGLDGSKITGNLTSATIPAGNITGELTSNQIPGSIARNDDIQINKIQTGLIDVGRIKGDGRSDWYVATIDTINFNPVFSSIPDVFLSVYYVNVDNKYDFRYELLQSVYKDKFDLKVRIKSYTYIRKLKVKWIAFGK